MPGCACLACTTPYDRAHLLRTSRVCHEAASQPPCSKQSYLMLASCFGLTAQHHVIVLAYRTFAGIYTWSSSCYLTPCIAQCLTLCSCCWILFTTLCGRAPPLLGLWPFLGGILLATLRCTAVTVWLAGFAYRMLYSLQGFAWPYVAGCVQRTLGQGRRRRTSPIPVGGRGGPSCAPPRGGPSRGHPGTKVSPGWPPLRADVRLCPAYA